MLGSTDTNNIEEENENDKTFIEQRFGTGTKAYPLEPTDKFQYKEYESAGKKTGQQDFSKQDKISFTNFEDNNLAVLEQQEETTPFTISRAKQLFLQKNDNIMPRIINKVLEQQEDINLGLTISGAKQPSMQENNYNNFPRIMNKEDNPGILSPSESILLANVNVKGKLKLSQLTVQTPSRFKTRPLPKISQIPMTQPQSANNQQVVSQKPFNLLNTKNFKAFDAQFGGSVPTNPGAAQLTSSIFEATPIKTQLASKPDEQTIDQPAPSQLSNVKVQPSSFYRYPANVIHLQRGAVNL